MSAPGPAIGFDFDHTLGTDGGLEREAFAILAAECGRPIDLTEPRWHGRVDAVLAAFRSGGEAEAMLAAFGAHLGVAADAERWRAICCALVETHVRPVPGAVELLRTLRAHGCRLAILTNGWTPLQQMKIDRALGDAAPATILVSDALRALKPSRAAFDALAAALGAAPETVWYVGDNPAVDVGGALAAGLRAVWFDAEGLAYPSDLPPPTARIGSLGDLTAVVENTGVP